MLELLNLVGIDVMTIIYVLSLMLTVRHQLTHVKKRSIRHRFSYAAWDSLGLWVCLMVAYILIRIILVMLGVGWG